MDRNYTVDHNKKVGSSQVKDMLSIKLIGIGLCIATGQELSIEQCLDKNFNILSEEKTINFISGAHGV